VKDRIRLGDSMHHQPRIARSSHRGRRLRPVSPRCPALRP
jgi:hypothetical protein